MGEEGPGRAPTKLIAYLSAQGIDAELVAPGVPMPTVPLAAAAIGVAEDQILKSLLFRDQAGKLVLAIACGPGRVNRDRLAAVAQLDRPRLADAATVMAATGYPAGGVPPVGHLTPIPVVLDRRVAKLEVAYGGAGAEDVLLRLRPADIVQLTGATVADIVDGVAGEA